MRQHPTSAPTSLKSGSENFSKLFVAVVEENNSQQTGSHQDVMNKFAIKRKQEFPTQQATIFLVVQPFDSYPPGLW